MKQYKLFRINRQSPSLIRFPNLYVRLISDEILHERPEENPVRAKADETALGIDSLTNPKYLSGHRRHYQDPSLEIL